MIKNNSKSVIKIKEYIQALASLGQFNGSILVAQNGNILLSQGYGFANFEHEILNTSQTKFRLGSITKQFTATAIFILQNKNKLRLHDKISQYFPNTPKEWSNVSILHLLNHTAGIPEHTSLINWKTTGREYFTYQKVISLFQDQPLDFLPGEAFQYSNSGYILLGAIIEQIAGQSYENFLGENIFKPLKMVNTGYDKSEMILRHRANGYSICNNTIVNAGYVDMGIPYAAGALYSTVEDLYLWDQSLYSHMILPKESLAAMFTPTPLLANYGYGFEIDQIFSQKVVGHSGGIHGFVTTHRHYPEEKLCIIALSNLGQEPYPNTIAQNMAAIYFGEEFLTPKQIDLIKLNSSLYRSLKGKYKVSSEIDLIVSTDTHGLLVEATGGSQASFFPESETQFHQRFGNRKIDFFKNEHGKTYKLILKQNGIKIKAYKVED